MTHQKEDRIKNWSQLLTFLILAAISLIKLFWITHSLPWIHLILLASNIACFVFFFKKEHPTVWRSLALIILISSPLVYWAIGRADMQMPVEIWIRIEMMLSLGLLLLLKASTSAADPQLAGTEKLPSIASWALGLLTLQMVLSVVLHFEHPGLGRETPPFVVHRWLGLALLFLLLRMAVETSKHLPSLARTVRHSLALGGMMAVLELGTLASGLSFHSRFLFELTQDLLWISLFYAAVRLGALKWLYTR